MGHLGIVNIINFVRAVEPRDPQLDLAEPVLRQFELVQHYGLPATWLLQYDTLLDGRLVGLIREHLDEKQEVGAWFEVVQPLVERVGLRWRGRFPWDWHAHVGFSVGYTPGERERLADAFMEQFAAIWGRTPTTVGSWFMDAHLLAYLADRWGVNASCVCKDQWGTDGYSMWGGYYGQAFYPSRANAYVPAQHVEQQIPIPLFRMLGSDPIYQYDTGTSENGQGVVTLEPVYPHGGGSPQWVRWFFDVTYHAPSLSFGYAQVGQENSFGWPAMAAGLTDQLQLVAEKAARGELCVQTLGASARWFRETYPLTPASAITALSDWQGTGRRSVWYDSRYYRANLFWEDGTLNVRDIHKFDERYAERYLRAVCTTPNCIYDSLPVVDGFLWSSPGRKAGLRPVALAAGAPGAPLHGGEPTVRELDADTLEVAWPLESGGTLLVTLEPARLSFTATGVSGDWALALAWGTERQTALMRAERRQLCYEHEDMAYQVACSEGWCEMLPGQATALLHPESDRLTLQLG